jgi:hypothetical protein
MACNEVPDCCWNAKGKGVEFSGIFGVFVGTE